MIGRETIWKHVEPGMYVRDKAGKTWRVEDKRWDEPAGKLYYLLLDRDGTKVVYNAWLAGEIVVLEPSEEEALATLHDLLGAEVVMVQDHPKKPRYCPPPQSLTDYQAHLTYFHGIYMKTGAGSRSIKRLIEMHDEEHSPEGPALIDGQYDKTNFHRHTR